MAGGRWPGGRWPASAFAVLSEGIADRVLRVFPTSCLRRCAVRWPDWVAAYRQPGQVHLYGFSPCHSTARSEIVPVP